LINPDIPAYLPLRVLSLFATLGCAAGCALFAFWLTGKLLAAVMAPLIFLSYSFVTLHGISARCDIVALCLGFWGFLLAFRFRCSPRLLLAVPFMLAAFFYKQQFVAGPLAVVLFLVMERRYRLAAAFAALMGGGVMGLMALFQFVVFQGQDFLLHFFNFNLLGFTWSKFEYGAFVFGMLLLVPLLVGLEALRVHRDRLVICYLLCAVILALTALSKVGSDSNYYLEPIYLLSALFATTIADRIGRAAETVELLVLLGMALFLGQFFTVPTPSASDFEKDRAIQSYLRHNFPLRAPTLGIPTGDLLRAGLGTPTSDIYQYSQLIRKGTLSDVQLVSAFESRKFKAIVMGCDLEQEDPRRSCVERFLTRRLAWAILQNYRLAKSLDLPSPERFGPEDRFHVWVPKGTDETGDQPPGP
jgi:hypothetical protein